MIPEAFADALAKGKGRTVLALQREDPVPYTDSILQACVENLQYDRQCEENRAEYVMRLIDLARLGERALAAILQALPVSEEGWDRDWMLDLLERFARRGDAAAWEALRDLAAKGDEWAQDNLATTDDAGLQWVEANVLPILPVDERYRVGFWLPDEESEDATPTQRRLRTILSAHEAERKAKRKGRSKPAPTLRAFFSSLDDPKAPRVAAWEVAKGMNRRELRQAAERLLRERNPRAAWRLAQIFQKRGFPLPLRRLFAVATRDDRGGAVCRVLGGIDAPQVRFFALRLLRRRPLPWNAIETLAASFRPGDETAILPVLPAVAAYDRNPLHNVVLDLIKLFDAHPNAAWQPHAEWIYEHSPCSMCRASALSWMADHGSVPASIREEAPYDAESEIRKIFAP